MNKEINVTAENHSEDWFSNILLLINKGLLFGGGACLVGGIFFGNELALEIGGGAFVLGGVMGFVGMMDQGAVDGEM